MEKQKEAGGHLLRELKRVIFDLQDTLKNEISRNNNQITLKVNAMNKNIQRIALQPVARCIVPEAATTDNSVGNSRECSGLQSGLRIYIFCGRSMNLGQMVESRPGNTHQKSVEIADLRIVDGKIFGIS